MFVINQQDQGTIDLSQQDYVPIIAESFLIDRRAQGLAPITACTPFPLHSSGAHAARAVPYAALQGCFARARRPDCLHRAALDDRQDRQAQVVGFAPPKGVDFVAEHFLYNE
jgi:hypothetical protein